MEKEDRKRLHRMRKKGGQKKRGQGSLHLQEQQPRPSASGKGPNGPSARGGRKGSGGGGGRSSNGGQLKKGKGEGAGASYRGRNQSVMKQPRKREKPTTLHRLLHPKPARLLFLTPTPNEEREMITEAERHVVDTTKLEAMVDDRPVHLVSEPEQIQLAVDKLRSSKSQFLGLDCEWRPQFKKSDDVPKIDVLQLASEEDAFVFHLTPLLQKIPSHETAESLVPLRDLMSDVTVIKGGQDPKHEMPRLEQTLGWPKGTVRGVLCTQYLSNLFNPSQHGLVALAALFLGRRMPKPKKVQNSNWAKAPLTEKQLQYAGKDATASRDVMMAMIEAVKEREGLETLLGAVDKARPLVDSTIPEEFLCPQNAQCASCGERASELSRKFGTQWSSVILFERCMRDSSSGRNVAAIPPVPSFLPRSVKIQRPGDEKLGCVYLPHRRRDVIYSFPATYTGKGINVKGLHHLAVAKALHQTGESRGDCDLRLEELVSSDGPRAVKQAVAAAGYKISTKKLDNEHHEAICTKKADGKKKKSQTTTKGIELCSLCTESMISYQSSS